MSDRTFLQQFSSQYAWQSAPAKRRFRFKKVVNRGMQEEHRLALTLRGVIDRSIDDDEGLQSSDYSTYQIFESDNLVFKLIDLENIKTSRVGYVPRRGIMSPAYIRLEKTSPTTCARYYYWFFYAAYLNNIFNGMGGGVRQNLTSTDLLNFPIPLPDPETQKVIADFLDRETTRIDQLIEKKQALVSASKQKAMDFADLLSTGGEDPTRARVLVDSPWLSEIPTDWSLVRAKFLFAEMRRPPRGDDDVITAFRDGQVCLRSKRRTEGYTFAELEVGYQHICKGDLVIHTMDAFAGAIGVSEDDGKATGEYAVCNPRSVDIVPEYYAYALRCMARRNYIFVLCPSVRERAPRFRFVRFAPVFLPVPPRHEQLAIVSRIECETAGLKAVQEKTLESIDRLREYRAALITAAVTGQIDVGAWGKRGRAQNRLDEIEARPTRKEARA